mgnify:CR=1 FL=1
MAKFNLGRLKNIGFHISKTDSEEESNIYHVLINIGILCTIVFLIEVLEKKIIF